MEFPIFCLVVFSLTISKTLSQTAGPYPQPVFTILSPRLVKSNSIYQVVVSLEDNSSPVTFLATISGVKDRYSGQIQLSDGGTMDIIEIPITNQLSDRFYNLSVKATTTDGYFYEEWNYIFPDTSSKLLLVETDKPIYKPEDVVRFRVILLKPSTFRSTEEKETVEVTIMDSQRNVIKRRKEETSGKGILSSNFTLASEVNLGDWTIDVTSKTSKQSIQFRVAEYEPPKFKVDLISPSYTTYNNSKITAKVQVAYTYGKVIKGTSTFKLFRNGYSWPSWTTTLPLSSDGSASVDIELVKNILNYWEVTYAQAFRLEVTATDSTGSTSSDSKMITIYTIPYVVQYMGQSVLRPGSPITASFKVTTPDGMPVSDPRPDAVWITLPACLSFGGTESSSFPVPPNGIVSFSLNTTTSYYGWSNIQVNYRGATTNFNIQPNNIVRFSSGRNLELTVKTFQPRIDQPTKINAKMNVNFASLNYILHVRGQVLASDRMTISTPSKDYSFQIPRINTSIKSATLVVFVQQRDNNEVISESIHISFEESAQNGFSVSLSKSVVKPGHKVGISLGSRPNSVCALKGVDQSVLLLKPDSDISQTLNTQDSDYQTQTNTFRASWTNQPTYSRFEDFGFVAFVNTMPYAWYYGRPTPPSPALSGRSAVLSIGGLIQNQPVVRSDFRETWLWEEVNCQASRTNLSRVVPESMTSWVITGYALNPNFGISFSSKTQLRVFKPFFLSYKLPYSVTQGEVFALEIFVHNHLTAPVTAMVTLNNDKNQFEFVETKLKDSSRGTKKIRVGQDEVELVTFLIKATKFGKIDIEVKAVTDMAGDAMTRLLKVNPRGIRQNKNVAAFLDLRSTNVTTQTLSAIFPTNRVPFADTIKVSVVGDMIGPSLQNLNNLLQMPGGCAEQTLRNFVPDCVIQDYLIKSGNDPNPTIVRYLEVGYQSVVANRNSQGSFAYWGYTWSIWLTAYAVKSVITAKRYITVDQNIIDQGLQFLVNKQNESGGYVENYNSYLQGGTVGNQLALTAYVTLTFLEAKAEGVTDPSYVNATKKGLEFISSANVTTLTPYTINLIAYVLHLADHPNKTLFSIASEKLAKRYTEQTVEHTYWDEHPTTPGTKDVTPSPLSVEMTSYALMTALLQNKIEQSLSIGRWLLRNRNPTGGFMSTQDTVVGITALTKLALRFVTSSKLQVIATYPGGNENFTIDNFNRMVMQEAVVPMITNPAINTTDVLFKATGQGLVLAQLSWSYYVENVTFGLHESFELTIQVTTPIAGKLRLRICTSFIGGNSSNMAVMEINLPTGYTFLTSTLSDLLTIVPRTVQKYETEKDNTKVNLYFNSMNDTRICLDVGAEQVLKVANPAIAFVEIYDYYNNTKQNAIEYFTAPKASVCDVCAVYQDCVADSCGVTKVPDEQDVEEE